jgi:protein-arginine kinase activator protein McsA
MRSAAGGSVTDKPSTAEEEYFARENAERMRKLAAEQKAALASTQRDELKKTHWMRCPKCGMELKEIAFRGVQVDRCFSCGGNFLDAGELEKIAAPEGGAIVKSMLRIFGKP